MLNGNRREVRYVGHYIKIGNRDLSAQKIITALYATLSSADREMLNAMLANGSGEDVIESASLQREIQVEINKILL